MLHHGHGTSILIQSLIKRYDTSPAQTHHYCKVLEILIAGKKQGNKGRYTDRSFTHILECCGQPMTLKE